MRLTAIRALRVGGREIAAGEDFEVDTDVSSILSTGRARKATPVAEPEEQPEDAGESLEIPSITEQRRPRGRPRKATE